MRCVVPLRIDTAAHRRDRRTLAIALNDSRCAFGLPARAPPVSPAASSDVPFAYPSQVEEPWDVDQTPPNDP